MRVSNANKNKDIKLTLFDVIRLVIWLFVISMLFFMKYLFPTNKFVMTYFIGVYNFLSIILFLIVMWRVELIFSKKKCREKEK